MRFRPTLVLLATACAGAPLVEAVSWPVVAEDGMRADVVCSVDAEVGETTWRLRATLSVREVGAVDRLFAEVRDAGSGEVVEALELFQERDPEVWLAEYAEGSMALRCADGAYRAEVHGWSGLERVSTASLDARVRRE